MAYKCAIANGNWSTAATWEEVSNTPTSHATTNITLNATKYTAAFTAPVVDATCAATGVNLFVVTVPSAACTITVTLQENSAGWVDCAGPCTATINMATVYAAIGATLNNWLYFRVGTPFVFLSATASYYRWKIEYTGSNTTTMMADAAGTAPAYWSTNLIAVPAIPGNTDLVLIPGQNATSVIKVSIDGTVTIGNLTNTAACIAMRPATASLFWDVQIGYGGELNYDNTASAKLQSKGCVAVGTGGTYRMDDKAGGAYAAAFQAKLAFIPTASGDCGLGIFDKSTVVLQGQQKTSTTLWKAHPSANWSVGQGVVGNTCTVNAAVDWAVNDEILIGPTGAYDQTEYKFIKTKTGTNEFTWSDTAGGAESGLAYGHTTDAWILNLTRNVVIGTEDGAGNNAPTKGCYINNYNTIGANVNIQWTRCENVGAGAVNKYGVALGSTALADGTYNYSVSYNILATSSGFHTYSSNTTTRTYTGLISTISSGASSYGLWFTGGRNKTLVDIFCINLSAYGISLPSSKFSISGGAAIACNTSGSSGRGGIVLSNSGNVTFSGGMDILLNRIGGIIFGSSYDVTISACNIGIKNGNVMANTNDIYCTSDAYINNIVFSDCNINDAAPYNYQNMITNSEIRIHNYNVTTMKHYAYRATGVYQATGAGLADTTVRTAGSYAVGMFPDATTGGTGLKWTSYVLARASKTCVVYGYHNRTTANLTVNLYLPGSTTADATFTDTTSSGWQSWLVSVAYAGTVDGLAKVEIIATGTAGSIYVDDWYNGTNPLTALDVWSEGRPALIIYPELGDPAAIWADIIAAGKSAGEILELIAAMCRLAKNTGFAAGPCVVRNLADTADLATITFDANGNVTNVVLA